MASQTILVYIDPAQLVAMKSNNDSLFLAKQVNGQFTVVWQSMAPVATARHPASYQYRNAFEVAVPSYLVNYGTVTTVGGSVTFEAAGLAQSVQLGQSVDLEQNGLFDRPRNNGAPGAITIVNVLPGNPRAILLDNAGNPLFVNVQSGMDIGLARLTPVDTYRLWFGPYQDAGTIVARNPSNAATVSFSGGATSQVISYNASGQWQVGPLSVLSGAGDEPDG